MSILWVDSGVRPTATPVTNERKTERLSKLASVNPVHDRHENQSERESATEHAASQAGSQAQKAYESNQSLPVTSTEIRADQVMSSPVITINQDLTTERVWALLRENYFRHLPVTSPDQLQILGIVSDRSISRALAQTKIDNNPAPKLIDIMSKPVLVATGDTDIRHIAKIMVSQRVGAMPIVDEQQHMIGIITRSDILRTIVRNHDLTLWV